ncbi:MAG: hypothetical protein JHC93_04580 [Parachlamydiales bacterium]|nr:hypothetical protein [Parachlamydiales bacterium]
MKRVSGGIDGYITADQVNLTWTKGQEIDNLTWYSDDGHKRFTAKKIVTQASLASLLIKRYDLGETFIDTPQLWIDRSMEVKKQPPKKEHKKEPETKCPNIKKIKNKSNLSLLRGDITVSNAMISIYPQESGAITFNDFQLRLKLPHDKDAFSTIDLRSSCMQNSKSGSIVLQGTTQAIRAERVEKPFNELVQILSLKGNEKILFNLQLVDFPVGAIDALWGFMEYNSGLVVAVLGPICNCDAQLKAASLGMNLNLNLQSDNVQANVKGTSNEKAFLLDPQSMIETNITPDVLEKLSDMGKLPVPFQLKKAAPVQVQIQSFNLPFNEPFLTSGSFAVTVIAKDAQLASPLKGLEEINLQNGTITASTSPNSNSIISNTILSLLIDGRVASVDLAAKTEGLPTFSSMVPINYSLQANHLSTPLINTFLDTPIPFKAIFGDTLSLNSEGRYDEKGLNGKATLLTPYLEVTKAQFTVNDVFSTTAPFLIHWRLSPEFIAWVQTQSDMTLQQVAAINGQIKALSFSTDKFSLSTMKINADFTTDSIFVKKNSAPTVWQFKDPHLEITGSQLARSKIALSTIVAAKNSPEFWQETIGDVLELHATANPKFIGDNFHKSAFTANAKSPLLTAEIKGEIDDRLALNIKHSPYLKAQFTQGLYKKIFPESQFSIDPFTYSLHLDPFTGSLKPLMIDDIEGGLRSDGITFKKGKDRIELKNVALQFQALPSNAWSELTFLSGKDKKPFAAEMMLTHYREDGQLNLKKGHFAFTTKNSTLPIQAIEAITNNDHLSILVGDNVLLNAEMNMDGYPMRHASVDIKAKGTDCQFNGSFDIDSFITLYDSPATLEWKITKERFAALQKIFDAPSIVVLKENGNLKANVRALKWPLDKLKKISLNDLSLSMDSSIDSMTLAVKKTDSKATIKDWTIDLNAEDLSKESFIKGSGQLISDRQTGSWTINGNIQPLTNSDHPFDLDQSNLSLNINLDNMSTPWLLDFTLASDDLRNKFRGLFGETINAKLETSLNQMQGPFNLAMNSGKSQLNVNGHVKDKVLMLDAPLQAQIFVTQSLSESLLEQINPLFATVRGSNKPVTLNIPKENFAFQLKPIDVSAIHFENAILNPGILTARTEGTLKTLINFLRAPDPKGETTIWSTPIQFHLNSGKMTYDRLDALINNEIHIASWGQVDLAQKRVDMFLGLPPDTLNRFLRIPSIPSSYMMVLPMKGPYGNVKVNWSKAGTQVASLITQLTGGTGLLVGKLFDIFSHQMSKNKIPPPTFTPFPWEKEMEQTQN